jgi:hypothetical protein
MDNLRNEPKYKSKEANKFFVEAGGCLKGA